MTKHSLQVMGSSKSDEWYTPREIWEPLCSRFHYTVDAAACEASHIVPTYWSIMDDGLSKDWKDQVVFCNPPYSDNPRWFEKFATAGARTVTAVVPVRAGSNYWFKWVYPYAKEILIIKGRVRFANSKYPAPFDTCVILWGEGTLEGISIPGKLIRI
jgi:phage N-6-adenine-methyltransferase